MRIPLPRGHFICTHTMCCSPAAINSISDRICHPAPRAMHHWWMFTPHFQQKGFNFAFENTINFQNWSRLRINILGRSLEIRLTATASNRIVCIYSIQIRKSSWMHHHRHYSFRSKWLHFRPTATTWHHKFTLVLECETRISSHPEIMRTDNVNTCHQQVVVGCIAFSLIQCITF